MIDDASKQVLKTATEVMLRPIAQVIEDGIGALGADRLHEYRAAKAERRRQRKEQIGRRTLLLLDSRGMDQTVEPNEPVIEAIFEAAQDENRPELQDLWARLLAAAIDPTRAHQVRQAFVDAVKKFEPPDAALLDQLWHALETVSPQNTAEYLSQNSRGRSSDQVAISLEHLAHLGCVFSPGSSQKCNPSDRVLLTPFGRELLRVLAD